MTKSSGRAALLVEATKQRGRLVAVAFSEFWTKPGRLDLAGVRR